MTDRTPMQRALDAEAKVTDLAKRVSELEKAIARTRWVFHVEYAEDGSVAAVAHDSDALRKLISHLDAALSTPTPSVGESLAEENERLREALGQIMDQAESDLSSAHHEICKLQGLDPEKHNWPDWSSPANTVRWFAEIRERFGLNSAALSGKERT